MTRFPLILVAALALAACTSAPPDDYVGLRTNPFGLLAMDAGAIQLTPHLAVTAKHAAGIMTGDHTDVEGMDVSYFAHEGTPITKWAEPVLGEEVVADGNSMFGHVSSVGHVIQTDTACPCNTPNVVHGFTFDADIAHGYSGGAVKNARGELIGMTIAIIKLTSGNGAGKEMAFAVKASDLEAHLADAQAKKPTGMPWWAIALLVVL
jgi:hypothetical protein